MNADSWSYTDRGRRQMQDRREENGVLQQDRHPARTESRKVGVVDPARCGDANSRGPTNTMRKTAGRAARQKPRHQTETPPQIMVMRWKDHHPTAGNRSSRGTRTTVDIRTLVEDSPRHR